MIDLEPVEPGIFRRVNPPTPDGRERPYVVHCPVEGCFWATAAPDIDAAQTILRIHPCPHFTPMKVSPLMPAPLTIIQQHWARMDDLYDKLMESRRTNQDEIVAAAFRAEIMGMAEVLRYSMPPALNTVKLIMGELVKRGTARLQGTPINTEGVEYAWRTDGTQNFVTHENRTGTPRQPVAQPDAPVTEDIVRKVRNMASVGITTDNIATAFGLPQSQVAKIIAG